MRLTRANIHLIIRQNVQIGGIFAHVDRNNKTKKNRYLNIGYREGNMFSVNAESRELSITANLNTPVALMGYWRLLVTEQEPVKSHIRDVEFGKLIGFPRHKQFYAVMGVRDSGSRLVVSRDPTTPNNSQLHSFHPEEECDIVGEFKIEGKSL